VSLEVSEHIAFYCLIGFFMMLNFCCNLTVDTTHTAYGCSHVTTCAALNLVFVTSLLTKQEDGNARNEEGQKTIENSTLVHAVGILANQAKATKCSTAAYSTIAKTTKSSLFPIFSHNAALVSNLMNQMFMMRRNSFTLGTQ